MLTAVHSVRGRLQWSLTGPKLPGCLKDWKRELLDCRKWPGWTERWTEIGRDGVIGLHAPKVQVLSTNKEAEVFKGGTRYQKFGHGHEKYAEIKTGQEIGKNELVILHTDFGEECRILSTSSCWCH